MNRTKSSNKSGCSLSATGGEARQGLRAAASKSSRKAIVTAKKMRVEADYAEQIAKSATAPQERDLPAEVSRWRTNQTGQVIVDNVERPAV
jgi:hypothetical protein